jgi:hypothetical protein
LSKEKGMKLTVKRNCHIQALNFNVTSNDFKSLKFRVNFYTIKNGLPADLLLEKNIVFEIRDGFWAGLMSIWHLMKSILTSGLKRCSDYTMA